MSESNAEVIQGRLGWEQLYVIEHPHGFYKVGISNDPERRLKSLQTASPYELELVATVDTENSNGLESLLHDRFAKYHYRDEWFELPDKQVSEFKEMNHINFEQWSKVLGGSDE